MSPGRFDGRHAVVVGGSGGMGRATCHQLEAEGCDVMATGASPQEVAAFVEDCADDELLASVRAEVLDVRDGDAVQRLIAGIDDLDVLINLAGIGGGSAEFTEEGFARTLEINLLGTMRTCYAARPALERRRGVIVNTASMMSFFGSGTAPAYATSKGGVVQLTKSLAIALGPAGVRVNAVAPGWIETPMTTELFADPVRRSSVLSRTPMQRLGSAEDVSDAICYLASPSTSFVTGVVLPVDGGYLAV